MGQNSFLKALIKKKEKKKFFKPLFFCTWPLFKPPFATLLATWRTPIPKWKLSTLPPGCLSTCDTWMGNSLPPVMFATGSSVLLPPSSFRKTSPKRPVLVKDPKTQRAQGPSQGDREKGQWTQRVQQRAQGSSDDWKKTADQSTDRSKQRVMDHVDMMKRSMEVTGIGI